MSPSSTIEGEKLLSEMGSEGAEFVAAGVETKDLLENLKGKGERPLRRFIGPCWQTIMRSPECKKEGSK